MGRWVVRTLILVIGATPFALGGCGSGEIGDARTAVELAPSVQPLQEVAPDHYRRLADSTFDSLSLVEQWDFVSEVDEIVGRHWETEREL